MSTATAPSQITLSDAERLWVQEGGRPQDAPLMAQIAKRESGLRPRINNSKSGPGGTKLNKNGTVDWGLYGINDIWRKDPVVGPLFASGAILTPEGATRAAIHILKVQGPTAWATYNPATDAKYLGGLGNSTSRPDPKTGPLPGATTSTGDGGGFTADLLSYGLKAVFIGAGAFISYTGARVALGPGART